MEQWNQCPGRSSRVQTAVSSRAVSGGLCELKNLSWIFESAIVPERDRPWLEPGPLAAVKYSATLQALGRAATGSCAA